MIKPVPKIQRLKTNINEVQIKFYLNRHLFMGR